MCRIPAYATLRRASRERKRQDAKQRAIQSFFATLRLGVSSFYLFEELMKPSLLFILLVAVCVPAFSRSTMQDPDRVEIQNESIKIVIEKLNGAYRETYYARKNASWRKILESGSDQRQEPAVRQNGTSIPFAYRSAVVEKTGSIESVLLSGSMEDGALTKSISLVWGKPYARISVAYRIKTRIQLQALWSTYSFVPDNKLYREYKPLDFVFTPQLRPEKEYVIADHTFRSPALMLQKGQDFVALVPVLENVDGKKRAIRTVADMQVETADKPFISIGLQNFMPEPYALRNTHVFYVVPDSLAATLKDTTVSLGCLLFLRSDAPEREGFREVVRYHWSASGTEYMQRAIGPQAEPFSGYIQKAWYQFLPQVALDTQYQGHPVTLLRQARLAWSNKLHKAADNDSWFNVWFNALRTAY